MGGEVRTVFRAGARAVEQGLPAALLGIPFVVTETGEPDFRLNEYLLSRRNGDWSVKRRVQGKVVELHGDTVKRAKLSYLCNRAYQLDVFRRWCAWAGVDRSAVSEADLKLFGDDLGEGLVTGFEGGCQNQTVNQYLTSVIDLLNYEVERGWRPPLLLKMVRKGRPGQTRLVPAVMRRVNPSEIDVWWTEKEIGEFIQAFETSSLRLAALIMHRTGLRLGETIALRHDTFPTVEQYNNERTKRYIRVTGKFDKTRRVEVDLATVKEVQRYIDFDRRLLQRRAQAPCEYLLIGAIEGGRAASLNPRTVQKAFAAACQATRFKTLSPHILRHHYAAHYLLRAWRRKGFAGQTGLVSSLSADLLSDDLLRLMSNLGHAKFETTFKYLYALRYLMGSGLHEAYSDELDGAAP